MSGTWQREVARIGIKVSGHVDSPVDPPRNQGLSMVSPEPYKQATREEQLHDWLFRTIPYPKDNIRLLKSLSSRPRPIERQWRIFYSIEETLLGSVVRKGEKGLLIHHLLTLSFSGPTRSTRHH